ncbi:MULTISPECIES: methyl-accepting chemotaxis protein [unclassified Pseudomonas]|uniref:methyl-accepting chemotaxis protein n=1 Tax=unclassified Pseudomonas TaxID=196821 RepID=UPI00177DAB45|nr:MULTISPECIES: methyl-accepting chemotaxis protein [unclassified Pseudomonas]MBD9654011.1 methyl-accepting chemotaxis protein [Pseudomonas sp. PDM12]CAH0131082.1 Methyl-accepting chemotaxis protein McpQ [Pseudomonas sp. Bi70]
MLRNIPLSLKLLLILACPLLGFLWLAALQVNSSYQTLQEMEQTQEASVIAQKVSQLITVLQRERGASGVFLGSQGKNMQDVLLRMRGQTDTALADARTLAGSADAGLDEALATLGGLDAMRGQIDKLAINNRESGARFTDIIRKLIGYTHAVERSVTDPTLARALSSLNQFIEMKERAGRERAMLGVVFNQDRFDADLLSTFSRNLGEFTAYSEGFRRNASADFVRKLDEKMQQPSALEVARLQKLAFETPLGQPLGVKATDWFQTSTSRIDLMGEVENELGGSVYDLATQARAKASAMLWMTAISVLVAMAVVAVLSYLIISNIKLAVGEANRALLSLSQRDLTARSAYVGKDEFGEISHNLNIMAGELTQIVQEIGSATAQVATAAEECSAVTLQTSTSLERQRQGTELVVTAINEMSATVREVAQSTNDAAEMSRQVNISTTQGRQEIERTVEVIRELSTQADDTARIIGDLKHESDSISSVLDVIRGIADQTNLLALNAAIEAARAGDHGRGFAVVASEVRTLAQKTQESTGNIQEMIANLQRGSDLATQSMEETLNKARAGASNIGRAGDLLAEIASGVSSISDRNMQIAAAAEEQSAVAEDINRNVVEINDVAIQVSSGAEQTAVTSQELARLADHQQKLVSRFRLA